MTAARSRQSIQAGKGLSRDEFWQAVAERDRQVDKAESVAEEQAAYTDTKVKPAGPKRKSM